MDRAPFQHSRPFHAQFDSPCYQGDDIQEGDRIVLADGEAFHVECFDHDDCPPNGECD
jgi:hypothetical protein